MNGKNLFNRIHLPLREGGWVAIAAVAFYMANLGPATAPLIVVYLFALIQLASAETWRRAFYPGLCVGLIVAATNLTFFWTIFSGGAIALWLVFALWIGLFTMTARFFLRTYGPWGWFIVPILWMGIEYFRSELYPLKFSWLSPGYSLSSIAGPGWICWLGVYGVGLMTCALAAATSVAWSRRNGFGMAALGAGVFILSLPNLIPAPPKHAHGNVLKISGVQLEFPTEREVLTQLNAVIRRRPDLELMVLPEYTLDEAPSLALKGWCQKNQKYLIVGGKDPAPAHKFFNTAYVISPTGEVAFKQVKSVPIQFFKDGLPATRQELWESPWGKIGICICYDLSYTRVVDRLARLGAQAIIVPTMDVADWGKGQHELHSRIAPARAKEYGVPVFRLASSGISQNVDRTGKVLAGASFPGQGEVLAGELVLGSEAKLPPDRLLASCAVVLSLAFVAWGIFKNRASKQVALQIKGEAATVREETLV